jgi:diaminopimelate dehydrogenase
MEKIKVAVVGFGNLGRACAEQIKARANEFELVAVFDKVADKQKGTLASTEIEKYKGKVDVVLVCVGSKEDAPIIVPRIAKDFNTVDSFDTHAKLAEYIKSIKPHGVSVVATGWDPGLMSIIRMYFEASITQGPTQSFWGPGVSMGHTNALKQIEGVRDAIQFTVPVQKMMEQAAKGVKLESNKKHQRVCYVVADKGDQARIKETVINMPDYFAGQDVKINFVSQAEFDKKYRNRNEHEGAVITSDGASSARFGLKLSSNARFTASVMLAYAIANYNLQKVGQKGVFTVADIAPKYLFRGDWLDLI